MRTIALPRPLAQLLVCLRNAPARLATHLDERSARRSLSRMNDHMLHDIGISRSQIDFAVRRPDSP